MIRFKDILKEALSTQREPRSPGFNEPSWDWRTQKKGDHWKTRSGKWGARAQTGEVDYFDDEKQAQQFAQHSHTGQAGTYVSGQFAKGIKEAPLPHKPDSKYHTYGSKQQVSLPELNRMIQDMVNTYLASKKLDNVIDAQGDVAYTVEAPITLHRKV